MKEADLDVLPSIILDKRGVVGVLPSAWKLCNAVAKFSDEQRGRKSFSILPLTMMSDLSYVPVLSLSPFLSPS